MKTITPEEIDQLLPQTQCGLCGHGGCMPYAEAMIYEKAAINLCPPGGVKTLRALGSLLQQDPAAFLDEMETKTKPALVAVIREDECIGCVKCINACPVDAILGSAKQMHTVLAIDCTGCELCIPACPVDCIDLIANENNTNEIESKQRTDTLRDKYNARQRRTQQAREIKTARQNKNTQTDRQSYIQAAIERAKEKKANQSHT